MRLGVCILPELRWSEQQPLWQRAEELGFHHAWTYDHLAWRSLADGPWFGAVPTLAAAAMATSKIRLGPLVASPNYRHPVPFAKELVSLDDLSMGRITLGIGAGGEGWDATVLGGEPWSAKERADRFAEFVELLDMLLRQPDTTYAGTWYSAQRARTHPGCVQQPRVPFAVAAAGPRGMRLAATYADTWVTTGDRSGGGITAVREQVKRLEDACTALGRDPSTIDRLVLTGPELDAGLESENAFADTIGRYEALGITDLVVHWPRSTEPYRGDVKTFERVVSSVL
ncbi:MAG: LLM class flavin-dependent oxidoreductase [Acidimicrobiia bacterium]|nr:LLM class flavin-dependent oxidoreductase [Acidimicrobiia bacterium]